MTQSAVGVSTATVIARSPSEVWRELEQIEQHVTWMRDARAIRFLGRRGIGAVSECDTTVGPVELSDRMEFVRWEEGVLMALRHRGAVSGSGQSPCRSDRMERPLSVGTSCWFPWWLGAGIGALLARPIFNVLWRSNLSRPHDRTEAGP